jgi:FSR family fosmidomycin resistance protein-like MFS transporter
MQAKALGQQTAVAADAQRADVPRIGLMTAAHLVNDSYGNYISNLLPLLTAKLAFGEGLAGVLVAAYSITSSVIQPALGYAADRLATRMLSVVGIIAAAVGAVLMGMAPHYAALLLLAIVSGVGTAAYHPQAAAMVVSVAGNRRATMMSVYLLGGNLGLAAGGALAVWVALHVGWSALVLLAVPGLLMAMLVYLAAPRDWSPSAGEGGPSLGQVIRDNGRVLTRLLAVVSIRSWGHTGLMAFLPLYLVNEQGMPKDTASLLVTTVLLTGAFGGVMGGYVADNWVSRRTVIVVSLFLAGAFGYLMLEADGAWRWIFAILTGLNLLGSFSVLTVKGQELLPHNVGLTSGFMLGLTIGLGGLFTTPLGFAAERVGLSPVLHVVVFLPPLAGLLALLLPE